MLQRLLLQFIKSNGRKPNNLEMILLRQKASKEAVNDRKIVNMFDRQPVDANKPILGGKNIIETEEQILQRLNKQNKDSINRLKNKKNPPEDMAGGGVAGLLGERPGYDKGLKVYPKITASKSNQGLGDGKNVDLQDLTYGGTLMYDQGPFSAGIEYLKGKDKFDFKDKDDTLFKDTTDRELANLILMMKLKDGSIKFKGNKDNQMINFSKSFAQGGPARTGYKNGNGVADEDAEKEKLGKRVRELMDDGYDFGEAVKEAMKEGYADGGPARQNFKMGKRAFLKLMGGVGAGIAGLKSGILGLGGKQATKKAVTETVKQAAGSGTPPPYFFKLVEKIKTMGDDVTPNYATKDREVVTKFKNYELTEDLATGEKTIQRMKIDDDLKYDASEYYGKPVGEDVYMNYKPGKGQTDETTGKVADEYMEDTSLIRSDKPAKGGIEATFDGVPDDILEEVGETIVKKADGGRANFVLGGKAAGKGIMATINKLFGKGTMTTADKIKRPQQALDREMFKKADNRLNDKRQMTDDEYQNFVDEIGENIEAYDFDGTVGDAKRIIKDIKDYEAEMFAQYKMGKLDPVAGDKSPARKRFLEKKEAEMEMSGDKKLMTRNERDELDSLRFPELYNYKKTDDVDISQGMIDLDEMNFTKNAEAAQIKLKYPGISDDLINKILIDDNPQRKAEVLATLDESFKMMDKGMGPDDIITTFKNTKRTKQATGGLANMLGE